MITEFGWLKPEVYGALTTCLLFSALAVLPIGSLIDKGLGRQVMSVGSLLAGLLLMVGATIDSLTGFYLVFAGIGLLHPATLYDAAFSVIANRFKKDESRTYITQLTLWGGFASTLFIPLIELLLELGGWRTAMMTMGVINVTVCLSIYARLPRPNAIILKEHKDGPKQKLSTSKHVGWAFQQPIFWTLLICFSFFAVAATAFKFHLYPILLEGGLSAKEVVAIMAILGPSQVLGRFLLAVFSERIPMINLGIITASILPIVFMSYAYLPLNFLWLIPCTVAFGAATVTMTIVKGTAIPELLTPDAYGAINGAMSIPVKITKALAPSIAAALWYVSNDYNSLLNVLAILGFFSALSFAVATRIPTRLSSSGTERPDI